MSDIVLWSGLEVIYCQELCHAFALCALFVYACTAELCMADHLLSGLVPWGFRRHPEEELANMAQKCDQGDFVHVDQY